MGAGAGLYMCDVVVKSSRSLSHLLMSSCLSLTVEALQGKMCQNSLFSGGVGEFEPRFQVKGSSPCQYIDTTRKAMDCGTTLLLTVSYDETLQQTFRPLLSKLYERRRI